MAAVLERRLFTRHEYRTMVRAGILTEDDPVELIEGEIVRKMPSGPSHASVVKRLNKILSLLAGDAAIVSVQDPVALDDFSEPEPDLMLLRPQTDFYADSHPTADVFLVIEVCDTSFAADREKKVPLYARSGVPEVWLVDLEERRVLVFDGPANGRYAGERVCRGTDTIAVPGLSGKQLAVRELGL
jgi:Uma2 family endonuclease